ncbi:Uncharacterised protein [uncultured Ruminococcus sp.]|nr:hypothetical protein [Clostridiales bacterium]SCH40089.1 Uncharacterised protein [uncultured Ruminococcus sp.]SCH41509.1 Uncharacterised protein [uncultured Clostridium sp.]
MMKNETMKDTGYILFTEQTQKIQIGQPEISELYKKAFLENDTGVSNEYCLNTTSWD